jgi:hypothetical protein
MIITCPICKEPLEPEQYNTDSLCTKCSAPLHCTAYPALIRDREIVRSERINGGDQAGCFYHPAKQAVVDCAHCGRFLCALCDLEVGEIHLCPVCLSRGKDKQGLMRQNQGRIRYDMLALKLAFWPFLFMPVMIFTAPLALYLTFKHYRTPLSVIPVNRWRFPLTAVLAVAQLIGCGALVYVLISLRT